MNLSVLVASKGRPTLGRALASAQLQRQHGDEILLSIQSDEPFGHASRNRMMRAAKGDWVLHLDDDDVLTPTALRVVRDALLLDSHAGWHVFRMRFPNGRELWEDREVRYGNIGTPMVVAPPDGSRFVATQANGRGGDFGYALGLRAWLGEPAWHEEVICEVRPA